MRPLLGVPFPFQEVLLGESQKSARPALSLMWYIFGAQETLKHHLPGQTMEVTADSNLATLLYSLAQTSYRPILPTLGFLRWESGTTVLLKTQGTHIKPPE